jgi:hypothetical protein
MKNISIYLLVMVFAITSCKKDYQEDTYNFYNSLAPYVELKSKTAITVTEGGSIKITAQMRTALQEPVDVNYTITGGFTNSGTIRINRNTTEGFVTIPVPVGTVPGTQTSTTAEVKLTTAKTTASNGALTVGRTGTEKEKVAVTIKK